MKQVMMINVPDIFCRVTALIIASARPDHKALCVIALALRACEVLAKAGIESIYVSKDLVMFNLWTVIKGRKRLLRYCYRTPAKLAKVAIKFDEDARKHGIEYARAQVKPFDFRLQGRDAWVKERVEQPKGDSRKPRQRRASTVREVVRRCARRYHPLDEFRSIQPHVAQL